MKQSGVECDPIKGMKNFRPSPLLIGGLVLAAIVAFQLFFRYQYEARSGFVLSRIDRLTGEVCVLPCIPPSPTPAPTAEDYAADDQRAIALVRERSDAISLAAANPTYKWSVSQRYARDGSIDDACSIKLETAAPDPNERHPNCPIRAVWLENDAGHGWAWEVRLNTGEIYAVSGNKILEAKYYAPTTKTITGVVQPFQHGDEGSRGGTFRVKQSDGKVISCNYADADFNIEGLTSQYIEQLYGKKAEFEFTGDLNNGCTFVAAFIEQQK